MVRRVQRIVIVAVAALLAWGLQPADAKYRYGQYSQYGAGSEAGFFVFGEGISINPRNVDAIVATVETYEPFGGGVNSLSQINPVWDNNFAGRLGLGYGWANGNRVVVSVWGFSADQTAAGDGPSGGATYFAVGPPIRVASGYVGDVGQPGAYDLTTEIESGTADIAFAREHDLGESFTVVWSAGLRYATYEETTQGLYDDANFGSVDFGQNSFMASKSGKGEMLGGRVAARGSWRFTKLFSLDASLGFSFLDGEITGTSSLTPVGSANGGNTPSSLAEITDDSRSGSIQDFDLTVSWRVVGDAVRVWLGWEQQVWDGITTDLVRNFPGTAAPLRDRDSVVFSGYKLGVFVRF
jgi:hypothetical protein